MGQESVQIPAPLQLKGVSPQVQSLLKELHEKSSKQEAAISPDEIRAIKVREATDLEGAKAAMDALMLDKFIALDEDKSHFIYNLLLSTNATTVVEAGTSFGVSTIYLALAVAQNAKRLGQGLGLVIGTEKEVPKAVVARENWNKAGPEVEQVINLKVGDLNETLAGDLGLQGRKVDFLLLDIWPYVALPALKLVMPHMRPGTVVVVDNTLQALDRYKELLHVLRDGPFSTITLPYTGGLEMSVYQG